MPNSTQFILNKTKKNAIVQNSIELKLNSTADDG